MGKLFNEALKILFICKVKLINLIRNVANKYLYRLEYAYVAYYLM